MTEGGEEERRTGRGEMGCRRGGRKGGRLSVESPAATVGYLLSRSFSVAVC